MKSKSEILKQAAKKAGMKVVTGKLVDLNGNKIHVIKIAGHTIKGPNRKHVIVTAIAAVWTEVKAKVKKHCRLIDLVLFFPALVAIVLGIMM